MARVGAHATISSDPHTALEADGLVVPGVGAFAACMRGLRALRGDRVIGKRLAGGRPVLGICVGMQILFERGVENDVVTEGCAEWPGTVERLDAPVIPHMGWNTVDAPGGIRHVRRNRRTTRASTSSTPTRAHREMQTTSPHLKPPLVTWSTHGTPFVAAVENGPLWATQFHPEKSGDAGAQLLANWVATL